jgi:hypothetical protein
VPERSLPPIEDADVELVLENQMDVANTHGLAVLGLQELTQSAQRVGTSRILI